jgi:hypothetical protein
MFQLKSDFPSLTIRPIDGGNYVVIEYSTLMGIEVIAKANDIKYDVKLSRPDGESWPDGPDGNWHFEKSFIDYADLSKHLSEYFKL